jgi:hypothetical protein
MGEYSVNDNVCKLSYVQLVGIRNFMSTAQNMDNIKILCKLTHTEKGEAVPHIQARAASITKLYSRRLKSKHNCIIYIYIHTHTHTHARVSDDGNRLHVSASNRPSSGCTSNAKGGWGGCTIYNVTSV